MYRVTHRSPDGGPLDDRRVIHFVAEDEVPTHLALVLARGGTSLFVRPATKGEAALVERLKVRPKGRDLNTPEYEAMLQAQRQARGSKR